MPRRNYRQSSSIKNCSISGDTLVLPILYNARHAVELILKFVADRLFAAGKLKQHPSANHDILSLWKLLNTADISDEEIRTQLRDLEPFVQSLSRIDDDGQELRYHRNKGQVASLATYSLVNLEVIRASLDRLSNIIDKLRYRTLDFLDELAGNACTLHLSRCDLMIIAKTLPPLSSWKEEIFGEKKETIKERFGLSNTQFSKALDAIKANREMKAVLGGETSLHYLTDEIVISVMTQWRKIHPRKEPNALPSAVTLDGAMFEEMAEKVRLEDEVASAVKARLTDRQLAELETIYYLGRDRLLPERYDEQVARTLKQHVLENDPGEQIRHLFHKPNLIDVLLHAVPRLGRASLAAKLSEI